MQLMVCVEQLFSCGMLLGEIPHGMEYWKCFAILSLVSLLGGPLLSECSLIEAGARERAHSCMHGGSRAPLFCIIWESRGCSLEWFYHDTASTKTVCRLVMRCERGGLYVHKKSSYNQRSLTSDCFMVREMTVSCVAL